MADVFTRPLLATEHGEFDTGAEALAFAIAQRCARPLAAVLPVVSNPEFEMVAPQLAAKADAEAATRRQGLESRALALGVPFELQVRHGPEAYLEIVDAASECAADLIVIRRRGRRGFLANLLLGEMVHKVVAHAPCSVLVAPRAAQMWVRQVLVGIDPQAPNPATLALAAALAQACALPLRVLCVATGEALREPAQRAVSAMVEQARRHNDHVDGEVRLGRPHQEIMAAAQACGADLVVVARHAGTPLARAWIGGTAQKVIGLADCPVLVHVNPPNPKPETPTPTP